MTVQYDDSHGAIARIVLDRAETRNAQDTDLLYALNEAFERTAHAEAVRVIVLAANGPHFSSGHDLREPDWRDGMRRHDTVGTSAGFGRLGAEGLMAREEEIYAGFSERWRNIPKPTIAEVHSKVIAGGRTRDVRRRSTPTRRSSRRSRGRGGRSCRSQGTRAAPGRRPPTPLTTVASIWPALIPAMDSGVGTSLTSICPVSPATSISCRAERSRIVP